MDTAALVLGIIGAITGTLSIGWNITLHFLTAGRAKVTLRGVWFNEANYASVPIGTFDPETPVPAVERRLGAFRFLTVFVVAGAVAYGWLVLPLPRADNFDGTSGAIFGVYGALAALTLTNTPREDRSVLALATLFALGGFSPRFGAVTKEIHLGGLLSGFALTLLFTRFRQSLVVVGTAVAALALLCGLVAVRTPQIKIVDRELHSSAASTAS